MMPLLAYCITEESASVRTSRAGVNGVPVESREYGGLRCFVSRNADNAQVLSQPIRDAALTFHGVLEEIFEQTAIIPFTFPTILSGEAEVTAHLAENLPAYQSAFARLRNMVQMEIRIQFKNSARKIARPSGAYETEPKQSGTEYLRNIQAERARVEVAAKEFRQACVGLTRGWRQRESSEGIRCFALIERASIKNFQVDLQAVAIQSDLVARLSGPWPAMQFLKEE